jgi:hypothetical protein
MATSETLTRFRLFWGLSTGLAVAVLCAGIFTLPGGKAKANDAIKLDLHDVPEAGLTLISTADQSFDQLLNDVVLLPGLEAFRERLKPYSVFVRNSATQTVIGYRIVWKVTNAAGREVHSTYQSLDGPSLMEFWNQPTVPGGTRRSGIQPGSSQIVSLLPLPHVTPVGATFAGGSTGSSMGAAAGVSTTGRDQLQNLSPADRMAAMATRAIEGKIHELAGSSKISVSIDGAVFEDGSVVGADETGFFSNVQTEMTAKHDMYQEFLNMLNAGQPDADVQARLAELTGSKPGLGLSSAPDEQYKGFKSMFARGISLVWHERGREGALDFLNARLSHPWATLYRRQ